MGIMCTVHDDMFRIVLYCAKINANDNRTTFLMHLITKKRENHQGAAGHDFLCNGSFTKQTKLSLISVDGILSHEPGLVDLNLL